MARIDIVLDDALEKRFRLEVAKRYGMKKGNMSMAVEEALKGWIKNG